MNLSDAMLQDAEWWMSGPDVTKGIDDQHLDAVNNAYDEYGDWSYQHDDVAVGWFALFVREALYGQEN